MRKMTKAELFRAHVDDILRSTRELEAMIAKDARPQVRALRHEMMVVGMRLLFVLGGQVDPFPELNGDRYVAAINSHLGLVVGDAGGR